MSFIAAVHDLRVVTSHQSETVSHQIPWLCCFVEYLPSLKVEAAEGFLPSFLDFSARHVPKQLDLLFLSQQQHDRTLHPSQPSTSLLFSKPLRFTC